MAQYKCSWPDETSAADVTGDSPRDAAEQYADFVHPRDSGSVMVVHPEIGAVYAVTLHKEYRARIDYFKVVQPGSIL